MKLSKLLSIVLCRYPLSKNNRTLRAYHSAVQRVTDYCNNPNVQLKQVFTAGFLKGFEQHLRVDGLKDNSISSYMNALRSLYREARRLGLMAFIPGLFDNVFTGSAPTEKRSLESDVIALILSADLSDDPRLALSRDLFVLSFLLHGMPFVDLAHLTKTNIQGDLIVYRRKKTGGSVTVPIHPNAHILLNKYASRQPGPYVLCLFDSDASGSSPK
ncbi:site-specific integrase, partial [Bacteroides sp. 51]|uniref:tyrosine-type recombinase/integrase n=1 Tax=Bacteroides sp. 51 TaxID=2302938 RepID=UPI0013D39E26